MILTNCAACAAPLPHKAKQCSRCKTRYCGPACQAQHWNAGGHKDRCKAIKRGGGAEQYHTDKNYKEAVAVAVEKCADDTKGQTCFICTQALHWKTKEGLVRGCSCRGTSGFVHVSCLVEQAKILVAEAEENNLDDKAVNARFARWHTCSLCEQRYHGVVCCALGWACWKNYVGRPETDGARVLAMTLLGLGLHETGHYEDALLVREAELAMLRRIGAPEEELLAQQINLAMTYGELGHFEKALKLERDVYFGRLKLNGKEHRSTLLAASNYAKSLLDLFRVEEAKSVLRKVMPVARRVLGERHDLTLRTRWNYAIALYNADGKTLNDLREAVTTLEDVTRTAQRVFGSAHPLTEGMERDLKTSRAVLCARETPPGSSKSSN